MACHLAENGLLVGRRPAVVGGGDWAARSAGELLAAGAEAVTLVAPDGVLRPLPDGPIEVLDGERPAAVRGRRRVEMLELAGGGAVRCDALVLAHGLTAVRNVDGAIEAGRATVYAQPVSDPGSVAAAEEAGREAASAAGRMLAEGAAA